jgi:hypothetical protein
MLLNDNITNKRKPQCLEKTVRLEKKSALEKGELG